MGSIWGVADTSCFKEMERTLTRLPRNATSQYLKGEQELRRIAVYPCAYVCSILLLSVCERVWIGKFALQVNRNTNKNRWDLFKAIDNIKKLIGQCQNPKKLSALLRSSIQRQWALIEASCPPVVCSKHQIITINQWFRPEPPLFVGFWQSTVKIFD